MFPKKTFPKYDWVKKFKSKLSLKNTNKYSKIFYFQKKK